MLAGELGEPPEHRPAGLRILGERRHRHQAAEQRVALAVDRDLALADAALRRLAGEIHLEQPRHRQAPGGRVGVDRVDELAELVHDARLVRLEGADEVPAEPVAVELVLALQVLGAVLADDLEPRLGEHAHLLERHVLRRRDDRDAGTRLRPHRLVRVAHRRGVHASSRAARSSSRALSLRAGSSTTSSSKSLEHPAELAPFAEPDRLQIVTRDAEIADPVRLGRLVEHELPKREMASVSSAGTSFVARSAALSLIRSRARASPFAARNRRAARPSRGPSSENAWPATIRTTWARTRVG